MHRIFIIPFLLLCLLSVCLPPAFANITDYRINIEWDEYFPPAGYEVVGFQLYGDGKPLCKVDDPNAVSMECTVPTEKDSIDLQVAALFSDRTKSLLSAPYTLFFTNSDEPPTPPQGSHIFTFSWGDQNDTARIVGHRIYLNNEKLCEILTPNATNLTCRTNLLHTQMAFTLTTLYTTGEESDPSNLLIFDPSNFPELSEPPVETGVEPTAIISSSSTIGHAPLTVFFDGSGSTAKDSAITDYKWDFGDDSTASGALVEHTFTNAGNFTTRLTVINRQGVSATVTTPIIIAGSSPGGGNQKPLASFHVSSTTGSCPLTITFDASSTTDPDGKIIKYEWDFGDGATGTGRSITHTYTNTGTFTARLKVTDNEQAASQASTELVVNTQEQASDFNIEAGEITINSNWQRVELTIPFHTPVVIVGPASNNNSQPGVIRLRNIGPESFEIRFKEWDYLDGEHVNERVSYLVMEKGTHVLPGNTIVEAGIFEGTTKFTTTNFHTIFTGNPIVLTTMASYNQAEAVTGRLRNVTRTGFQYVLQAQESHGNNAHVPETINYIAWGQGSGSLKGLMYEARTTANAVAHKWIKVNYDSTFHHSPFVLANMQTTNGPDTASLRMAESGKHGFQLRVAEEQSRDEETIHANEVVGFLVMAPLTNVTDGYPVETATGEKNFTFRWKYDGKQPVKGFKIYMNNSLLCETDNGSGRMLTCTARLIDQIMDFTLTAVTADGSESEPSNLLRFDPTNHNPDAASKTGERH